MGQGMDYRKYIASADWKAKRAQRLEIDGHRCAVCKHDGSEYRLEVHHLHYKSLGNEDALYDLLTACSRCHETLQNIELLHRYEQRKHISSFVDVPIFARMENHYGMANTEVPVDFVRPSTDAQRASSRSNEQMGTFDQNDYIKEGKDRR